MKFRIWDLIPGERPGDRASWLLVTVISAAIVVNAMFLQSGNHPAPVFSTGSVNNPAAVHVSSTDHELTMSIQAALADLGYYSGALDGQAGPATRVAIAKFARHIGQDDVNLRIDDELLISLKSAVASRGVAVATPDPRPLSGEAGTTNSRNSSDPRLMKVQQALANAAYGPITADGLMGEETAAAIRRFQIDNAMPMTGEVDDKLIARLVEIGALPSR